VCPLQEVKRSAVPERYSPLDLLELMKERLRKATTIRRQLERHVEELEKKDEEHPDPKPDEKD